MVGPVTTEPLQAGKASPDRLESWKAIAAYLKRDVTTVQRWERREGMPVHRHVHDKRGSVYALSSELDAWRQGRVALLSSEKEPDTQSAQDTLGPPPAAEPVVGNAAPTRTRRKHLLPVLGAIALLALSAVSYVLYKARTAEPARPKIASLAVLPLRNLSGDPAQEYLADGMTEALIGRLAAIHDLRVISHTSVMRYKNPQASVTEIARTLGADAIVEGSVSREDNRIRVTVQMIRATTDEHFWSETFDRNLQDVLALESELAQSIADRVEVTLTGTERQRLAAARSIAPEVYESYLKGQFALDKNRKDRAEFEEGLRYFEDAIRLDPTFAPAYVGEARAFSQLGTVFVGALPEETRPKVIAAARKAIELDPDLAEAHVLLANTEQEEWHWTQAETEYRRALDLSPNDANAHAWFALWLLCQGRTEEAISWAQRGRQLDPLAVSGASIAWILYQSHRYEEALREVRSVLALQPDDVGALTTLGFILSTNGHAGEAIPALEKVLSISKGSPAATGVLIRAYALAGRRNDALRLLEDLQRRRSTGYVPAAAFVNGYLGLGDYDDAFTSLEQAYTERSNILQFLKVHPYFDPIRGDPRFTRLVQRVWSETR
jgi:TolB-like protein/Flp pilus assembly protein TadD